MRPSAPATSACPAPSADSPTEPASPGLTGPRRRLLHRRFDSIFLIFIGVIYLWIASDRTWEIFASQDFGDVYDHLALRMAQGRFDLPAAVLGGEAFVVAGKYYGYWPPFPAVIRLPLVWLAGDGWPGHTARAFSWLAAMLSPSAPPAVRSARCTACWVGGNADSFCCRS